MSENEARTVAPRQKDNWDKLQILFQAIGPVLAAVIAAYLGFLASRYLERQQTLSARVQLYAELMSNREAANSALRKEMFNTTLSAFLDPANASPEDRIIKLELLAHNFHSSLDIAPLFEHLYRVLSHEDTERSQLLARRLERLAGQVNQQQLAALEAVGARRDGAVDIESLPLNGEVLFDSVSLQLPTSNAARAFSVEVLRADIERKTLRCRLSTKLNSETSDLDFVFDLGLFDFPMIRNIRLPGGDRCALVLTKLRDYGAEVTLVYFPGSRASLKEKPYYDEIIEQLLVHSGAD